MMRARARAERLQVSARETDGTLREVCLWPDARGQYQPLLSHCEWGLPRRASGARPRRADSPVGKTGRSGAIHTRGLRGCSLGSYEPRATTTDPGRDYMGYANASYIGPLPAHQT
jgi:hypothetical protein